MTDTPKPINDLLDEWFVLKNELDAMTTRENALRKEIFDRFVPMLAEQFPDKPLKRGTNKVKIDHGMALVVDHRLNYRIDRPGLESAMQNASENERAILDAVISYSPKIKEAQFDALTGDDLKLVTPFVTVTPGLPGIEIKPQNKVRW